MNDLEIEIENLILQKQLLDEIYKSKAQMRFFHAMAAKKGKLGKVWKKRAKTWDKHSRGKIKDLPEKIKKNKRKRSKKSKIKKT